MPLVEEVTRGIWVSAARERLAQDLRLALRTLGRDWSFTSVAILTLAVGIAATVSVFAVVNAVLLAPLPFADPGRLVMVWEHMPQSDRTTPEGARSLVSAPNFVDWRARNQTFESLGAISQIPLNITGLGDADQVDGLRVTAEFFEALAVPPLLGRTIRSGEDVAGGPRTVVLSYQFWQQRCGGRADVIGRLIAVNGAAHEIVGVMPASFAFPGARAAELYIPLQIDPASLPLGRNLITVGRLKPDASLEAAQIDMDRVAAEIAAERPVVNTGYTTTVIRLLDEAVGGTRRILWVLFGAVVCLLLLACANVANLLLMRATTRAPEMAVRLALGAGRLRLVHQLVIESLVVTFIGGAIGLALASLVVPLFPTMFPPSFPLPRANEISIDRAVVLFTLLVAGGVGLLFGIVPALHAGQGTLSDPLRSAGRSLVGTHARVRRVLVVCEMALAVVLVIGATLMGRSLVELSRVHPGFETERVLTLRMLMLPTKYRDPSRRVSFLNDVLTEIRATPGVVSASSVHFLPLSGSTSGSAFYRSDRPAPLLSEAGGGDVSIVTPDYFRTMGIPLLQGRDFSRRDGLEAPRAVIVNETLVKHWFGSEPAIGKHLSIWFSVPRPIDHEIVGIVRDVRSASLEMPVRPAIYLVQGQETSAMASLVVRTTGAPSLAVAAVRGAIARVDPEQGVSQIQALDTLVANATARPQVQSMVLGAFGVLALMVAAIGLYGVMSYGVERRRREMGVRLALGAAPSVLLRQVVKEGLGLAAVGVLVGSGLAAAASPAVAGLLYETQPTDPIIYMAVGVALTLVAALASLGPARRATRVDPMLALRDE